MTATSTGVAAVALPAILAASGAVLIAVALSGDTLLKADHRQAHSPRPKSTSWWWRAPLGLLLAVAIWAITGWPVAGVWIGILAAWVPSLAAKGRQRRHEMAVAAGVARLAAMMRDQVLVGADVAEAALGCVDLAPAAVGPAISEMARRLQVENPGPVLADFAAQVDDEMAEMLAVSLQFALTRRTARLADLFDEVARATDEQVRARRSIEKDRRRLRTAMWSVMGAVGAWLTMIYLVSGTYLTPYHGLKGQAVMALAGAAFAAGLVGLAGMDRIGRTVRPRLIAGEAS